MLAPWDLNGNNPDPSKAPDVVNNSYICPFCGLDTAFDNLRAAGIVSVVVTGNFGPTCGSVFDPGGYNSAFAVGALAYQANAIADFSSRGPSSPVFTSPQITAPGTDVPTSIPVNDYSTFSGTSFAAPVATGSLALLWSAKPDLLGNVDASVGALESSAIPILSLSCGSASFRPNNVYGYGSLNVKAAVGIK
jgi:serine protease AprX